MGLLMTLNSRLTLYALSESLCTSRMQYMGNFKQSLTGSNSERSFSKTSYHTKVKEPRLFYFLPIAGGRIVGFILFPKGVNTMRNAVSVFQDLNSVLPDYFLRR